MVLSYGMSERCVEAYKQEREPGYLARLLAAQDLQPFVGVENKRELNNTTSSGDRSSENGTTDSQL